MRRRCVSVGFWCRCVLFCLFCVMVDGYDNSYFPKEMFDKEKYFVQNPDGEQTPEKTQAYFWRYLNSKPVLRGNRFLPNYLKGTLEIIKPDVNSDETFKCDAVTSDELVIPFYHSVVTILEATVRRIYTIYGYMMCQCDNVFIREEGAGILQISNEKLCGNKIGANCPFEVTHIKAEKTEKLNISNQWTNNEYKMQDTCMVGYVVRYPLPSDFKRDPSCKDYNCNKEQVEKAMSETKQVQYSKGAGHVCTGFNPINWTSRIIAQCPSGYRPESTIFCVPCQPGTKTKEFVDDQESICHKCPEGTFNFKFHQSNCTKCVKPLEVNREATRCTRVKRLMGEHEVDMKALLKISQQVGAESGFDPNMKMYLHYWKKIQNKKYWVISILGFSVAFVLLIGFFVWKCNKSIDDKNFAKYGREKVSTKHMMFKAAAEVYKKKQIVESLTPEEKESFNKKSAKEQDDYLSKIYERDKLKRRLHEIRYRPIGPPLGDVKVGVELPLGNTVGGVKVTRDADKNWDKNNSAIPFLPAKNKLTPQSGIGSNTYSAEKIGKRVDVASIISSESPSPHGIIAGTLPGKSPGTLLLPGKSSTTPYALSADVSRRQKSSLTPLKGELGDKGKVATRPFPKVVIKDVRRAAPMTIPKIPKSQSMMKMEKGIA